MLMYHDSMPYPKPTTLVLRLDEVRGRIGNLRGDEDESVEDGE